MFEDKAILAPFEEKEIPIKLNLADSLYGEYYGKIIITAKERVYKVPYSFGKYLKLKVNLEVGSENPDSMTRVHDQELNLAMFSSQGLNAMTFLVKPGIYTAYSMELSTSDYGVSYILMESVGLYQDKEITLSLSDARPFIIQGKSPDGKELEFNSYEIGYQTYNMIDEIERGNSIGGGWSVEEFKRTGDWVVFISDKPKGVKNTDIILDYNAIPMEDSNG